MPEGEGVYNCSIPCSSSVGNLSLSWRTVSNHFHVDRFHKKEERVGRGVGKDRHEKHPRNSCTVHLLVREAVGGTEARMGGWVLLVEEP